MSEGNRNRYAETVRLAFIVIAGVALYWAMFYDMGLQSGVNQTRAEIERGHHAADTAKQIDRSCVGMSGKPLRECVTEIIDAERGERRDESDLAAQWQAADWVMWAAIISGAQLIVTGIGLLFIKQTLDATVKAVEETGRATIAMENQNAIAIRVQRPWVKPLSPFEIQVCADDNLVAFESVSGSIKVSNFGQGVAINVGLCVSLFYIKGGFSFESIYEWLSRKATTLKHSAVFPSEEAELSYPNVTPVIDPKDWGVIQTKSVEDIALGITIRYQGIYTDDVFSTIMLFDLEEVQNINNHVYVSRATPSKLAAWMT